PTKYAELLAAKMKQHNANVWLVNTGWSGGSYGKGARMKLRFTRAIIDAIHSGVLAAAPTLPDPFFGIHVVTECPEVPTEILIPRNTWEDKSAYDETARKLVKLFNDNFRQYEAGAGQKLKEAAPRA
ncbi:MAG TPA: phosphoenolpyruvate carboxykinase (ATP), partial [Blastocatellia bacterium]|nr:phosphoenolpyruvate carboxykinase (ATP) [Blastocatellia bacterium]